VSSHLPGLAAANYVMCVADTDKGDFAHADQAKNAFLFRTKCLPHDPGCCSRSLPCVVLVLRKERYMRYFLGTRGDET
jgi:hypothetical protein